MLQYRADGIVRYFANHARRRSIADEPANESHRVLGASTCHVLDGVPIKRDRFHYSSSIDQRARRVLTFAVPRQTRAPARGLPPLGRHLVTRTFGSVTGSPVATEKRQLNSALSQWPHSYGLARIYLRGNRL